MIRLAGLLAVAAFSLLLAALLAWVSAARSLPDFSQWPAGAERKDRFLGYLRPLLETENARVLEQRRELMSLRNALAGTAPSRSQRRRLAALANEYDLDAGSLPPTELIDTLSLRIDAVPVSLGLAQAAKESGWGTSRFAAAGNALFGQRCFETGCGMVPRSRRDGLRHEVRTFASPAAAVESYVRNLNTHPDYAGLRRLRAELRRDGKPVTGFTLARALTGYSERGSDYIEEIRQMIRFNRLGAADGE